MLKKTYIFFLFFFLYHFSEAQIFSLPSNDPPLVNKPNETKPSKISSDGSNFIYKNELSGQLLIGSRGIGLNIRRAQNMTIEKKRLFEFDVAYINHPKEYKIKTRNNDFRAAKNYNYGKINSCFFLRGGVGFQNRLYRRGDRKSVEIRYNTNFGLSAAFLKPIYVYLFPNDNRAYEKVKHDPAIQSNIFQSSGSGPLIAGRASFFEGIDEVKIVPGLYAKCSAMIEYGSNPQELKALEVGVIADGFLRPLDIMKFYNREQIVVSLYASFVFGKKWF